MIVMLCVARVSLRHIRALSTPCCLQAFYSKFYIPEKDLYPQEVEFTDKLARALVVR